MKVTYKSSRIPEWVRVPFEDIQDGEIMKDLKGSKYYENGTAYFKEHWVKKGKRLEPVHELNRHDRWTGYYLPDRIFFGMTALVER